MNADAQQISQFYASSQGVIAARLICERLEQMWPHADGMALLGLGFANPYIPQYLAGARRCVSVTPGQFGAAAFPPAGPSLSCMADEESLPFPDLSFDRVLVVHGLEAADNARRLLREAWRVLKDDGRMVVIAPNRRGWWAHVESTPFGQGQPYSPGQIGQLLRSAMFRVERRDTALYVPPTRLRVVLRSAQIWEDAGRVLATKFAGVTLTEAAKDLYGIMPVGAGARRRMVLTEQS